jgi:hypothetical protein
VDFKNFKNQIPCGVLDIMDVIERNLIKETVKTATLIANLIPPSYIRRLKTL